MSEKHLLNFIGFPLTFFTRFFIKFKSIYIMIKELFNLFYFYKIVQSNLLLKILEKIFNLRETIK